jgi:glucose/mannose-6-phosphate isomerase
MLEWIDGFPSQLVKAVDIAHASGLKKHDGISRILITGLGGSGIGGTIAASLAAGYSSVPVCVSKSYDVPAWVNNNTLVIACSYSGNTEETLSAFEKSVHKQAKLVCITSGGALEEKAQRAGATVIKIPGGFPPRTCLGYALVQILKVLEVYSCVPQSIEGEILSAARLLGNKKQDLQKNAHELADFFYGRLPILYVNDPYAGVAERWKQQINENSKMLCHFHVIPEMNHNEMVGWREGNENTSVLFIKADDDDKRNLKRMEICASLISNYTSHVKTISTVGETQLEKALYAIYLGDWVSLYLAQLRGADPVEIKVIELLKSQLAK